MYRIIYTPSAKRDLKKLPLLVQKRIDDTLNEIKSDPFDYVKKLKAVELYSLRVGEYRIILSFDGKNYIIYVIEVGNRSKVYRKF